jgi:uridylate kinase
MRARENYVVKLGGHVLIDEKGSLRKYVLSKYVDVVANLWREGVNVHTVVGGGHMARLYIEALASLGASKALQDVVGIEVTKLNAKILAYALNAKGVSASFVDAFTSVESCGDRLYVMGGLSPAQSTTAVAALLAETVKAVKLVIATDVEGLYTEDPKKSPRAMLLKRVGISEVMKILKLEWEPGSYELLDLVALQVIERSKIPTCIVNGLEPQNVEKAIRGEQVGTLIIP